MGNERQGEVEATILGNVYTLRYPIRAIRELCEHFGAKTSKELLAVLRDKERMTEEEIVFVTHTGMRFGEHPLGKPTVTSFPTFDEMACRLMPSELEACVRGLYRGLNAAITGNADGEPVRPTPAGPGPLMTKTATVETNSIS